MYLFENYNSSNTVDNVDNFSFSKNNIQKVATCRKIINTNIKNYLSKMFITNVDNS